MKRDSLQRVKKKVLVVDDNVAIRKLLTIQLESCGFEVSSAAGGGEALEKMSSDVPDVVVCDLVMPEINGIDLLQQLRNRPEGSTPPVYILSADCEPEMVRQVEELGGRGMLQKSGRSDELVDVLETVCNGG